ncbi:MAG: helix-turn-helix domain-containing protein [Dehalococcoidia bacterium]
MNARFEGELTERLFWRDEILQAMYWMHGEGLGDALSARALSGLLDAPPDRIDGELRRLTDDGLLEEEYGGDGAYRLTDLGMELGKASFQDEFANLTRSAHGACGPGCDCHRHPTAAAACRAAR